MPQWAILAIHHQLGSEFQGSDKAMKPSFILDVLKYSQQVSPECHTVNGKIQFCPDHVADHVTITLKSSLDTESATVGIYHTAQTCKPQNQSYTQNNQQTVLNK